MRPEIKILLGASVFYNFSVGLLGPLYAMFVKQIGGGILEASGAWALYTITMGIMILIMGRIEDKLEKKHMVVLGYGLCTLGIIGYNFVSSPMHLYIVQAILGLGSAVCSPAWSAIYSVCLDRGKESSEWGYWEGLIAIMVGLAALTGGYIVSTYGFGTLFILMSIASIINTAIASMLILGGHKVTRMHGRLKIK